MSVTCDRSVVFGGYTIFPTGIWKCSDSNLYSYLIIVNIGMILFHEHRGGIKRYPWFTHVHCNLKECLISFEFWLWTYLVKDYSRNASRRLNSIFFKNNHFRCPRAFLAKSHLLFTRKLGTCNTRLFTKNCFVYFMWTWIIFLSL